MAINNNHNWIRKLAIGTVQFGLDYGISNTAGQVNQTQVIEILTYANAIGIDTLDTAVGYGNSEIVLGNVLTKSGLPFSLVSKFLKDTTHENFDTELTQSLQRLSQPSIKAYLAHDFNDFKNAAIRKKLQTAKAEGKIQQLGVSVYYPEELEWLMERNIQFDLIQCPFNLFDQRFKPLFPKLKQQGVEIHTRSSFLQGLFFMEAETLPEHFESIKSKIEDVQKLSQNHAIPLSALLLNFCVMQAEISKVVFGVLSVAELKENTESYRYFDLCKTLPLDNFSINDDKIINPGNWPSDKYQASQ